MKHATQKIALPLAAATVVTVAALCLTGRPESAESDVTTFAGPQDEAGTPTQLAGDRAADRRRTDGGRGANGFYHAPRGSRFVFDLESKATTFMGQAGTRNGNATTQQVTAKLVMTVLDRSENDLVVGMRFVDPRPSFTVSRGPSDTRRAAEQMRSELAHRVLYRMRDDGRTVGFRFESAMSEKSRSYVRALVSGLRFVIPSDAGSSWEVEEQDQSGPVLVAYRRLPSGELRKQKVRYLTPTDTQNGRLAPRTKGGARGRLNPQLGWVDRAALAEVYEFDLEGTQMAIASNFAAKIELVEHSQLSLAELADVEVDLDAPWSSISGTAEEADAFTSRIEQREWRAVLGKSTLDDLIAALLDVLGKDPVDHNQLVDAQLKLIWKLKLDPENLPKLDEILRGGKLPGKAVGVLLAGLGAVQDEGAQNLLASYANNATLDESMRLESIMAMVQIDAPNESVVDTIRNQSLLGSETLRGTARLMLGTLVARRPGDSALMNDLMRQERSAKTPRSLANWLEAVGNTGNDAAAKAASRYLDHADESVRTAAVHALRDVADAASTRALTDRLDGDRSERVRFAAAATLAGRTDATSQRAIDRVLLGNDNERMRRVVLEGMAQRKDAFARQMLERAARSDASDGVRDLARQILAS